MSVHEDFLTEKGQPFLTATPPTYEAWGQERVALSFADTVYVFDGMSTMQRKHLLERFGNLQTELPPEGAADVFQILKADDDCFNRIKGGPWDYEIAISHSEKYVHASGIGFGARIGRDGQSIIWTKHEDNWFFGPMENCFRVAVAYRLLESGSVVLHSAGVASDGQAHVFFGKSGAGKTTLCRILDELDIEILSDELNAIRKTADGFSVIPMPFAGDFGQVAENINPRPLASIFRLKQAGEPNVLQCSSALGLAGLIGSAPYVNVDPFAEERLMLVVQQIGSRVQTLEFRPDSSCWAVIKNSTIKKAKALT